MKNNDSPRLRRRTFLGGGISAGLAATFLRPLEAAADNGPPTRVIFVHRPCGTIPDRFFPKGGTVTDFQLAPIMAPFEPFKKDMVILNNVTAPREGNWQGDKHAQGMIVVMTGSRGISDGEPISSDSEYKFLTGSSKSIDQILLTDSPKLQGSPLGSIALGSYRDSVQGGRIAASKGAPNMRVLTYKGANMPVFPEVRPTAAVQALFGNAVPGGSAAVARQQTLNKSILDLVAKDLTTLRKQVPSSQRAKLDAHLTSIQDLETQIAAVGRGGANCTAPTVQPQATSVPAGAPAGLRIDAAEHTLVSQEQLKTIKLAMQCDLVRTATFTFAHGNSDIQFAGILPNFGSMTGHHDISHMTDAGSVDRLTAVDTFYCQRTAELLTDLKNTLEVDGSSMLDHTLVVFFSGVSLGAGHTWNRMPITLFGGSKAIGLVGGRNLDMGGRYLNDIWASMLGAFGVPLPSDNKFGGNNVWNGVTGPRMGQGAVAGVFS